jgi:hypothetical protein
MPKRSKKKTTKQDNHLNLNKLPIPDELVKVVITFLDKKWTIPRIPKKMNSRLYSLRTLYVNNETHMLDINTPVKIKPNVFCELQKEFKYLVPPSKEAVGKIIGYVSPESCIRNEEDYWKIKHAKKDNGDVLYKVLFLKTHKIWDHFQGFQGNIYYPHELYRIEDTQELPYKSCAYFTISKMSIYGIYYFYPHEVKYYLDIEDRQVYITKKNKIMFDKRNL